MRAEVTEPVILATRQDADAVVLELRVPQELVYFRGHFPDYPVLPGVVQTHWAILCARRSFALGTADVVGVQVKFKRVIVPETTVRLALDYERARQRLSFEYADATAAFSSGIITFGAA